MIPRILFPTFHILSVPSHMCLSLQHKQKESFAVLEFAWCIAAGDISRTGKPGAWFQLHIPHVTTLQGVCLEWDSGTQQRAYNRRNIIWLDPQDQYFWIASESQIRISHFCSEEPQIFVKEYGLYGDEAERGAVGLNMRKVLLWDELMVFLIWLLWYCWCIHSFSKHALLTLGS